MKLELKKIGETVLSQDIECWLSVTKEKANKVLIVGGVHGNENEGIEIANGLLKNLKKNNFNLNIALIPCLNKDGETHNLRSNFNDVDLNRNIPTRNWTCEYSNPRYKPGLSASSEPETVAFMSLLESFNPDLIISLHSFTDSLILFAPGNGKFDLQVKNLSKKLNLKLVSKMSYEVTGSLNTLSVEREIPTVTVEAPRDATWKTVRPKFIEVITSFLKEIE